MFSKNKKVSTLGATVKCADAIKLVVPIGNTFEIRAGFKTGAYSGYYNDQNIAARDVEEISGKVEGIYILLNGIPDSFIERGRLRVGNIATKDSDITRRRWLFVDIDPERSKGISATNGEKGVAYDVFCQVADYLGKMHFSEPIKSDSGNGYHLKYPIDMPNTNESRDLIKSVLHALHRTFSNKRVKVDTVVYNASRIAKLEGTLVQKGKDLPERPHRRAKILSYPQVFTVNPEDKLQSVIDDLRKKSTPKKYVMPKAAHIELTDSKIIDFLLGSPNSNKLYLGNWSGYKSQSEADSALCCHMAFYTRDYNQIYNIFCGSGLYRKEKWTDRKDYAERTIKNALLTVISHYDPAHHIMGDQEEGRKIAEDLLSSPDTGLTTDDYKEDAVDILPVNLEVPPGLLKIPGILGEVVKFYEITAFKTQPQFAVQAALALGSVAMGRRWVTDQNNYSSLYFMNVGLSSSGKEHARTIIEKILIESDCISLLGPSKYASGSGVFSEAREHPTHITIIDEFGRLIESIKKSGNSNSADALTQLMEAWGLLGGTMHAPGLSTISLTKKQIEDRGTKTVHHPAITLLTMTTPNTFYSAISNEYIASGCVPRFLIVESEIGRRPAKRYRPQEISIEIKSWIKRCANAHIGTGNLDQLEGPEQAPDPVIIPIEEPAMELFEKLDLELLRFQDALDVYNLAELLGRTKETAQRVALIVAVSCNSFTVKEEHAKWAIEYVRYYAYQTVDKIRTRVSNSDFEAICKQVIHQVKIGKEKGATFSIIKRTCTLYTRSDDKVRASVITVLKQDYDIQEVAVTPGQKGGRPTTALIFTKYLPSL